jgi:hypothetical protein
LRTTPPIQSAVDTALVGAVRDQHLTRLGLPPEAAAAIAKTPGMTQGNPVPQAASNGKPFEQVIKPNQPFRSVLFC